MHDACLLLYMGNNVGPTVHFVPIMSQCTFHLKASIFDLFLFLVCLMTFVFSFVSLFVTLAVLGLALCFPL